MDADDLLEGLDPDQRAAVTAPGGLVAVLAGAGSGKTLVLTRRIAHRVATGQAGANHVVAITFTREAAAELRRRLAGLGLRDGVVAGTFHATALGLLRQRWADQGRPVPTIVNDRARLVAEVLGVGRGGPAVPEIVTEIDWARARLVRPEAYADIARRAGRRTATAPARVAEAYAGYEQLKRKRRVVDLDDLLSLVLDAMRTDRTFTEVVRWRFRHLHVDEAQDLNPLQHAVLEAWRGGRPDLFLVGDPCQAIYGWNGADPELLDHVEDHYPGVTVVRLATNHRCSPQVVEAGRHVLRASTLADDLVSGRPDGPPVRVIELADEQAEAEAVVRLVHELRPPGGRWRGIAVLARTNAVAAGLADSLTQAGVPVRTRTRRTPLDLALAEAARLPSTHRLLAWAAEIDIDEAAADDDERAARRRVAAAIDDFVESTGGGDGRTFAAWAATTLADEPGDGDGVEVLTFHAAKGREWPAVVVAGFEVGLVPHAGALSDLQRAEEARLAYVAITRGAHRVAITSTARRGDRVAGPSPYLAGLDTTSPPPAAPPVELRLVRRAPSGPPPVLTALESWRSAAARAAAVPASVVCTDDELRALARARPATVDQVADVLGPLAARRFGPRIVEVVAAVG